MSVCFSIGLRGIAMTRLLAMYEQQNVNMPVVVMVQCLMEHKLGFPERTYSKIWTACSSFWPTRQAINIMRHDIKKGPQQSMRGDAAQRAHTETLIQPGYPGEQWFGLIGIRSCDGRLTMSI
jgi:hypothetical protein